MGDEIQRKAIYKNILHEVGKTMEVNKISWHQFIVKSRPIIFSK